MRIHTRTVVDMASGKILEDEYYEYDGLVALAGGGGGGDTTTTVKPPKFQKPYVKDVFNQAQSLYNSGGQQYYPDNTVAGINPTLQSGFDTATGQGVDYTTAIANLGGEGVQQLVQGANPLSNPFFQPTLSALLQPTVNAFNEDVLPQIDQGAISAGQYGGSRQGVAQGIATDRLGQNLLNTSLQFGNEAYQSGLDALGRGILAVPAVQQTGLVPSNVLTNVGAAQRGIEQENINAAIDRFNFGQQQPYNELSYYAGLVGNPVGSATEGNVSSGGGGFSASGALGGAAAGGALAASTGLLSVGAANAWNPFGWAMIAAGGLLGSGVLG